MCKLCDEGKPQDHAWNPRRGFLKAAAATGAGAALLATAGCDDGDDTDLAPAPPANAGAAGVRYLIKGGAVMSMDPAVGNFAQADVLVEGKTIVQIAPSISATGLAGTIDARGKVVMPGFIDTHHHLFETSLRSYLADGLLFDGLDPDITQNYFQKILSTFAPVYRPSDVYINTLFGALSQLDTGVTTVMDVSQIHHSPEHTEASIRALKDSGQRSVFGYFESAGNVAGNQYPNDARRIKTAHFSSSDQLLTMVMGGEIYLPGYEAAWAIGRELGVPIACHIVGTFGMRPTFDALATAGQFGPDNLFIHVTGMSDMAWERLRDAGAGVSLAVPIEMNMAHGTPPLIKAMQMGVRPSLSSDVECTLTADPFTQMRSTMALQRMFVNANKLGETNMPPTDGVGLMTTSKVLEWATVNGARDLKLEARTGTLSPGKDADIVLLDAEAINVAPLNHVPGAVVSLMERSNVDSVIVAGRIRKWCGKLQGVDMARLKRELYASRDHLFSAAGITKDLFRAA
jgi:cytosine/adenosine deaminase-related metal-dependent hydrolase